MIIVKLKGGLGNQLFQYAFGRKLAILNNTTLKFDAFELLDRSPKENFTYRDYRLQYFNINVSFIHEKERAVYFPGNTYLGRLKKKIRKKLGILHEVVEDVNNNRFNPNNIVKAKNIYACGFWQSQEYFNDIIPHLKTELTIKTDYLIGYAEIINNIKANNSISIHIRRGDYVTNPVTNSFHGVCSIEYYQHAINYIKQNIQNPYFFIFSDEITWVKSNINFDANYTVVEANPDYIDLHLMSLCKHNIIANSSFSWWGAWLNANPDKIVIAPQKWFHVNTMSTQDLIPENWLKL